MFDELLCQCDVPADAQLAGKQRVERAEPPLGDLLPDLRLHRDVNVSGLRLSLTRAIRQTLAGASTLVEAAPAVFRICCEQLDWEAGMVWLVEPAGPAGRILRRALEWHFAWIDPEGYRAWVAAQKKRFETGAEYERAGPAGRPVQGTR